MTDTRAQLTLRYTAGTDRGFIRDRNQDVACADHGLVAVADDFGPSTDTALASASAIEALATTRTSTSAGALLDALRRAAEAAATAVRDFAASDTTLDGAGTTLTALGWSDSELALVHVGDSRAYLLRDHELLQLTHDDTRSGRSAVAVATRRPRCEAVVVGDAGQRPSTSQASLSAVRAQLFLGDRRRRSARLRSERR